MSNRNLFACGIRCNRDRMYRDSFNRRVLREYTMPARPGSIIATCAMASFIVLRSGTKDLCWVPHLERSPPVVYAPCDAHHSHPATKKSF
jgi:hypothetical protein